MNSAIHPDDTTGRSAGAQNGMMSPDFKSAAEAFTQDLATKLSIHLGLEVSLALTGLESVCCREWTQGWTGPSHFTMFKLEPLRGVCVLEMSALVSLGLVDRLMGGPGRMPESAHELGDIERLVLEPVIDLLLREWCGRWSKVQALTPVILGHESNGRFVPVGTPDSTMLVMTMDVAFGACSGAVQMAFPLTAVQPLLVRKNPSRDFVKVETASPAAACQWNDCFNDVPLSLTAEWPAVELSAREVLKLKVGDVLTMDLQSAQQVEVRFADLPRFIGRPGSQDGQWAVELTQAIKH